MLGRDALYARAHLEYAALLQTPIGKCQGKDRRSKRKKQPAEFFYPRKERFLAWMRRQTQTGGAS
jgi:hypothetical protein